MSIHTDFEGPLLFVGGCADGARYSVNLSRSDWAVPNRHDPGEVDHYTKRTLVLGRMGVAAIVLHVMVLVGLDDTQGYVQTLEHIASALGGTLEQPS